MKVVRAADQPRVRWRNDGGWTRDIARDSPLEHGFSWRISVADVEANGPFSRFDGCDRLLVLLDGVGMDLLCADDGTIIRLGRSARRARFAGEATIVAQLRDGPTSDLNVIWNRSRFHLVECAGWNGMEIGGGAGSIVMVHVMAGSAQTDQGVRAVAGDTMIEESGSALRLTGDAEAIVVVLVRTLDANQSD